MESERVPAKCIEAELEGNMYVECFMRRGGYSSIAMYLKSGEWLARFQSCESYSDCAVTIERYLAMALAKGYRVRVYDDEAAVYRLGEGLWMYIFKREGHIVIVDVDEEGWQDYVGSIGMRPEDLIEYVYSRGYSKDVRERFAAIIGQAAKEAAAAQR